MIKRYLAKIIAKDSQGLQLISAYCAGAKVKITEIKYLPKNKIFLLSLERLSKESDNNNFKINSICKFEFVDSVKSKNVNQNNLNLVLELFTIDLLKNKENYEINLIFSNNAYITLSTEIVEATLEDQNKDL
jgi:hypothetical protein|tara:strand:- start:494 stop:889 length:396 start_codon:yes stop_codon:yes gene_type:complete